jgi:hypothetical protein
LRIQGALVLRMSAIVGDDDMKEHAPVSKTVMCGLRPYFAHTPCLAI